MAIEDVLANRTLNGFTDPQKDQIDAAIRLAYGSAIGKTMFDTFLAGGGNIVLSTFEADGGGLVSSDYGGAAAFTGTGKVLLDFGTFLNLNYISRQGNVIEHTVNSVVIHELSHALTGLRDNWTAGDYEGPNVDFVNTIYAQVGITEQSSYSAQYFDSAGYPLRAYSNNAAVQGVVGVSVRVWDTGVDAAGNPVSTNDLLIGTPLGDTYSAGGGNDILYGFKGDDNLRGGLATAGDTDIALYSGDKLDYDVRLQPNGTWKVRHARDKATLDEGTDTLVNIEKIRFGDGETFDLRRKGLTFQTDFALVIDATGSMGDDIASVKAQGAALINAVFADGRADARIGIVTFKDTTIGEPTVVNLPFTDQDEFEARKTSALNALNAITVGGGGDLPETANDGLLKALNGAMGEWRPGAGTLRIALFTDAAVKDTALLGAVTALAANIGVTVGGVLSASASGGAVTSFDLVAADGAAGIVETDDAPPPNLGELPIDAGPPTGTSRIEVYTILTGSGSGVNTSGLEEVSAATGGSFFRAPSNDALVETLFRIINLPPVVPNTQDFNGDGRADILWQNADGTVAIWVDNGDGYVFAGPTGAGSPGPDWRARGTADFDGDGKPDIFWQNVRDGTPAIWLMDGAELVAGRPVGPGAPGPDWSIRDARDFSGDGKADFLWQNTATSSVVIWDMDGLDLLGAVTVNGGVGPGPGWTVEATGDFNGDGKTDIVWDNVDGSVGVWLLDGSTLIAGASVGPGSPGRDWGVRGTGDFDGDGKDDIVLQRDNGTVAIWLMDGLSLVAGSPVGPGSPGADWLVQGAGDVNADGKSDIIWQRTDGTAAVWLMDGLTLISGGPVGPSSPGPDWLVTG